MHRLLAAAFLLTGSTAAIAAGSGIDPQRISQHIKVLASDEFEGRGPASPGEDKTVAYISEQFKAAGLQPGGDNGSWTQAMTLERFGASDIKASVSESGAQVPLRFPEDVVLNTRRAGTSHVAVKNAPLVFVGYGVSAPEQKWDDYKGLDLHGKVAVVLVNDPDFEAAQPGRFGGKAMTYYGRWTYKFEELGRRGAAGVLIVHEKAPASYGWEVILSQWTQPLFDIPRSASERAGFEGWVQRDVAVKIFKSAGLDFDAEKRRAQSADFRPVVLKGATFSADFAVKEEKVTSHNVIGRIPGTSRPKETILFTAHWDHLGIAAPDERGDKIYNGAIDNASGTAAVIELARAFKAAPPPRRTLVFIGFTAEEKGLLGSEYYAAHPVYPLATTVAAFNIDSLPSNGRTRNISITGAGKLEMEDDLARLAAAQHRVVDPEAHPESGGYYRSDHFPLAKRGVPAVDFHAGNDLENGGREASARIAASRKSTYHQATDEWRPDFDFGGALQDLDVVFALGSELANSDRWTGWKAGAEFKPARDKSAAQRR